GIGSTSALIVTHVTTLSARAGAGGNHVLNTDDLIIDDVSATVGNVAADGSVADVTDVTQSGVATVAGNGVISLRTINGSLTLNDGTGPADGNAVVAHGSGAIILEPTGAAAQLVLNADVRSGS